jgi:hypothetical protein
MSLFVVTHKHKAETCPAGDPKMGPMLLKHLSKQNAAASGINIQGEAVLDGKHTLVLVLDAKDKGTVQKFMAPFAQAGSVEAWKEGSHDRRASPGVLWQGGHRRQDRRSVP